MNTEDDCAIKNEQQITPNIVSSSKKENARSANQIEPEVKTDVTNTQTITNSSNDSKSDSDANSNTNDCPAIPFVCSENQKRWNEAQKGCINVDEIPPLSPTLWKI